METVTNRDLLERFEVTYPKIEVAKAKPLDVSLLKKRQGVTLMLKNGDILLYFPRTEN